MMRTAGVLLAGGASRRYGSPKAWALYRGRCLYEWVYDVLAAVSEEVVIVTQEALVERFPPALHVVKDHESCRGQGPLAGIYTAMKAVQADYYAVLPCDMPFMSAGLMRSVVEAAYGTIGSAAYLGERRHPLVSCWSRAMHGELYRALLAGHHRVLDAVESAGFTWLDARTAAERAAAASRPFDPEQALRNVNRPDDMKEGKPS